jgi:prepilin-type N-terminal cleavage/methylation domain-containing protein/prepilin-type processing-associated H-X9-DG protein
MEEIEMFYRRQGFTLIELLVVIAIIAILAAILMPVFAQARERARVATCTSNVRQIAMSVQMYLQDYDGTMPIWYAYHTGTPHKGTELLLQPYIKNTQVFRCPDDNGGPFQRQDVPGTRNYWEAYGSSYRFERRCFSVIAGESSENNFIYTSTAIVTDALFTEPANTRIMRDEMFPWFGTNPLYGYLPNYYQQWHPQGGGIVFADGHAKFITTAAAYDQMRNRP